MEENKKFIPTGIKEIDTITGGMERGKVTFIGGRPGVGKSAIAVKLATNFLHEKYGVMYLNLESNEVIEIALNRADETQDGDYIETYMPNIPGVTLERIFAELVDANWADVIVVDYLQLVGGRADAVSFFLGLVARSFNCAVIVTSQVNRRADFRDEKMPLIADLPDEVRACGDYDAIFLSPNFRGGKQTKSMIADLYKNEEFLGKTEFPWSPHEFVDPYYKEYGLEVSE